MQIKGVEHISQFETFVDYYVVCDKGLLCVTMHSNGKSEVSVMRPRDWMPTFEEKTQAVLYVLSIGG